MHLRSVAALFLLTVSPLAGCVDVELGTAEFALDADAELFVVDVAPTGGAMLSSLQTERSVWLDEVEALGLGDRYLALGTPADDAPKSPHGNVHLHMYWGAAHPDPESPAYRIVATGCRADECPRYEAVSVARGTSTVVVLDLSPAGGTSKDEAIARDAAIDGALYVAGAITERDGKPFLPATSFYTPYVP